MAWSFTNDRPIYVQISERIISSILSGEYSMGERLPSVRELADTAAVNPNTVQRAMGELEAMGLVENQRTTGKFVTEDSEKISLAREQRGEKLVREFFKQMAGLGFDRENALTVARELSGKEDNENG